MTAKLLGFIAITKWFFFRTDLYEIYHSPHLDPELGPQQLRNKVEWDLRFYFCRRGKQNIYTFTKDTFKLSHHEEWDLRYIEKAIDEESKNHKDMDNGIPCGFMPEIKGSKFCPVTSYLTYLYSLDPSMPWLWQTPKCKEFPSNGKGVWYSGRMGHNKLDNFVSSMCKLAGFGEEGYTNHSLRSTGITLLKKDKKFGDKQVMAFSGHTSLQGLVTYEHVSEEEKIEMGNHLGSMLTKAVQQSLPPAETQSAPAILPAPQQVLNLPAILPPQPAVPILQNATSNVVAVTSTSAQSILPQVPANAVVFDLPDEIPTDEPVNFNLMDFLEDDQDENVMAVSQVQKVTNKDHAMVTSNQFVHKKSSPKLPVFHGCKIGNITININK